MTNDKGRELIERLAEKVGCGSIPKSNGVFMPAPNLDKLIARYLAELGKEAIYQSRIRETDSRFFGDWVECTKEEAETYSGNTNCDVRTLFLAPQPAIPEGMALADVIAERKRQIEVEGWTPEHDDEHASGTMAVAAACYALDACGQNTGTNAYWRERYRVDASALWPWDRDWWKPSNQRRNLIKAVALILAEIERLDRAAAGVKP